MTIINTEIEKICNENYDTFIDFDNIIGVANGKKIVNGVKTSEDCIAVFVKKKLSIDQLDPSKVIPSKYGRYKTDVVEVGDITAYNLDQRVRPAPGGYSVGCIGVTAGTIGCAAYYGSGNNVKHYILSNNHILANENLATIGDPILQPGPIDGGIEPVDIIGYLADYEPILFITPNRTPVNYVDCAIAECATENISPEVFWQGYITGIASPSTGMAVKKTGRTTGFTTGTIEYTNATVYVSYGTGQALFVNQIVTNKMACPGDSGSLLLNNKDEAVGLLFAGNASQVFYNPIKTVISTLGITLA